MAGGRVTLEDSVPPHSLSEPLRDRRTRGAGGWQHGSICQHGQAGRTPGMREKGSRRQGGLRGVLRLGDPLSGAWKLFKAAVHAVTRSVPPQCTCGQQDVAAVFPVCPAWSRCHCNVTLTLGHWPPTRPSWNLSGPCSPRASPRVPARGVSDSAWCPPACPHPQHCAAQGRAGRTSRARPALLPTPEGRPPGDSSQPGRAEVRADPALHGVSRRKAGLLPVRARTEVAGRFNPRGHVAEPGDQSVVWTAVPTLARHAATMTHDREPSPRTEREANVSQERRSPGRCLPGRPWGAGPPPPLPVSSSQVEGSVKLAHQRKRRG